MKPALEDVKILEYGELISAPFCSKMLADLGASTLKIEHPEQGDVARRKSPFLKGIPGKERSGLFLYLNTNKRGVTLNLEKATGRDVFKKLIEDTDILIENTMPGTMEAIGLGYDTLKSINPSLVMTSITSFGQTGPYRGYKGNDLTGWHMSGIGIITPRHVGTTEQEPLKIMQLADFITGMTAAVATLCALHVQRRKGIGQQVDVSALETLLKLAAWSISYWPYEHRSPTRADRTAFGPYHFIKCKDGWFFAACSEEHHWQRMVVMMGNPTWAQQPLFNGRLQRGEHWESIDSLITNWTMKYTRAEIFEMAKANKVPIAPLNTMAEVLGNRQLHERDFFVTAEHPEAGKLTYPGIPYKSPGVDWTIRTSAPLLGQHNEEVYCNQLGYTKAQLTEMHKTGVI